jgi:hypothetical protein
MKKVITSICVLFACYHSIGQTITQSKEPVINDVNVRKLCDSVGTIPKAIGAGTYWDFGMFTINTSTVASSYVSPSSYPPAQGYSNADLVEYTANGDYIWSTGSSQFELLGISAFFAPSQVGYNFNSNGLIYNVWPTSFGTSNTDTGSGLMSIAGYTGTGTGTIMIEGSGNGTISLPGSDVYNNVLQTRTSMTLSGVVNSSPVQTVNLVSTKYSYYHSSQKFPILTVYYEKKTITTSSGPTVTKIATVERNAALPSGITENNFNSGTDLFFPNPAKDHLKVNLSNADKQQGNAVIYDELGKIVKQIDLGNDTTINTVILISDLKPGVYFVKTSLGERTSTKKLIIQ